MFSIFYFVFVFWVEIFLRELSVYPVSKRSGMWFSPEADRHQSVVSGLIYVSWNLEPSNRLLYDTRKDLRVLKTNGSNYQPKASIEGYAKTKQNLIFIDSKGKDTDCLLWTKCGMKKGANPKLLWVLLTWFPGKKNSQ